jgi:dihydroorotate dehydrogenase
VRAGSELPLLVKLPLKWVAELAEVVASTTADTLVIAAPPIGAAYPQSGEMVCGNLYSPVLHSLVLEAVQAVRELVELPLIATGGIHTLADAQAFLQAGAMAFQIDSLLFIDPQAVNDIAAAFQAV